MTTHREMIEAAFAELKAEGTFAELDFACCTTCATVEIPEDKAGSFIYAHGQEMEAFGPDGNLTCSIFLGWGDEGEGEKFALALERQGLVVRGGFDPATKIEVLP